MQSLGFHRWTYDTTPELAVITNDIVKAWDTTDLCHFHLHLVNGPVSSFPALHVIVEIVKRGWYPTPVMQPQLGIKLVESFDGGRPFFEFDATYKPAGVSTTVEITPVEPGCISEGFPFDGVQLRSLRVGLQDLGLAPLRLVVHSVNSDCIDSISVKNFPREFLSLPTILRRVLFGRDGLRDGLSYSYVDYNVTQGELHFVIFEPITDSTLCLLDQHSAFSEPSGLPRCWLAGIVPSNAESEQICQALQLPSCKIQGAETRPLPSVLIFNQPKDLYSRREADEGVRNPCPQQRAVLTAASGAPDLIKAPRSTAVTLADSIDTNTFQPFISRTRSPENGISFHEVFDLWKWLDASNPEVQWALPPEAEWHAASREWTNLPWWNLLAADEIVIYTDGSANKHGSSAGAVFFIRLGGHWFFGGYLQQKLKGPPCAHRAELHGILISLHWLNSTLHGLSYLQSHTPAVHFCFDATSAGYKAFGQWGGAKYSELCKTMRSLCYFVESRFGFRFTFEHVHGHVGDPGNEAANTVAQLGLQTFRETSVWSTYFDLAAPAETHWLWAFWKPEWTGFWDQGYLRLPTSPYTTPNSVQIANFDESHFSKCVEVPRTSYRTLQCKVATANVLSLLPGKLQHEGLRGRARTEALHKMFFDEGYHIVGVQETRCRVICRTEQQHYFVFSSPATPQGHLGVQIWIARAIPLGEGSQQLQREHFRIVAATPRLLVLKCTAPFFRTLLVCGHAPTSQAEENDIKQWWATLRTSLTTRYADWPQILMIDANARIGSLPSRAIGTFQSEEQDTGGHYFHEYVLSSDIWLPATFVEQHQGPGETWRHPRTGRWYRGDYIGLPAGWTYTKCSSWLETRVDISLKKEDHRVSAVCFDWVDIVNDSPHPYKFVQRLATDDLRADLHGQQRFELLEDLQSSIPSCPWNIDVHTHTALLQTSLRRWTFRRYACKSRLPRRKNMSPATWELVQQKRDHRQHLFQHVSMLRRRLLGACFKMWASPLYPVESDVLLIYETKEEAHWCAKTVAAFRDLGLQVTRALREDDRIFFESLAQEMGELDSPQTCKSFWQKIRWTLPKTKAKRRLNPCMMEILDAQWVPHFSRLEAGEATTSERLLTGCVHRQQQTEVTVWPELSDLPTKEEIESALRSLQHGRAPGPDALPSELFQAAASELAGPLQDLYLKTTCWCTEAVQCKGGITYPIFKRGSPDVASNYRGVVLLNTIAKVYHSWARTRLMNELSWRRLDTQIGGFSGQQALFGSQSLQVLARIAKARGRPLACLFVDVQGAYHFLVRELVFGHANPEDLEAVVKNLHDWGARTDGLALWLALPGILERLRMPKHLVQLLREVHVDTWTKLPHIQDVIRTAKGSRPGSPLADAVFAALMADVHIEVHRILEDTPTVSAGFKSLEVAPFAITWADDLAVPIVAENNAELNDAVTQVFARAHAAFERRGLLLNLSKGKTTAVMGYRGEDSAAYRRDLLSSSTPGVFVDIGRDKPVWLHYDSSYKHLGVQYVPDGDVMHEINCRLGQARTTLHDLRRIVFSNHRISTTTRLRLLDSLVISQLCYGVSAWGFVPPKLLGRVEAFIARAQRRICGFPLQKGPTNEEMRSLYNLPTLRQRLAVARISYAVKIWTHGPEVLRTLLSVEHHLIGTSWWGHILEDLNWCKALLGDRFPLAEISCEALERSWKLSPQLWVRAAKKALSIAKLQETIADEARRWHLRITRCLQENGAQIAGLPQQAHTATAEYSCECGKSFTTIQGLYTHRRKVHGYEAPEARFAKTATCPSCLKYLWTRARLRQHLAYIPRDGRPNACYRALILQDYQDEGPVGDDDRRHPGINRRDALQTYGPQREDRDAGLDRIKEAEDAVTAQEAYYNQIYGEDQVDLEFAENLSGQLTSLTQEWFEGAQFADEWEGATVDLQDRWLSIEFDEEAPLAWHETVTLAWGRHILPDIIQHWHHGIAERVADEAFFDLIKHGGIVAEENKLLHARRVLRHRQRECGAQRHDQPHRAPRFGPSYRRGSNRSIQSHQRKYCDDDGWRRQWLQTKIEVSTGDRPLPFYRQLQSRPIYLVIHLFAGRRRRTDYHHHLAELTAAAPFNVHILSLDTAIDATLGNLSSSSRTWQQITTLLESGLVASGMSGSPCETFSAARYNQPTPEQSEAGMRWPRPLRDGDHPWGLQGLSLRELRQLRTGSAFALQTLYAMSLLLCHGGSFLSEHPAPPPEGYKVSVFRTPLAQLLLGCPEVSLKAVQQAEWGAVSNKPTGLMSVRMPTLTSSLLRWRNPTPKEKRICAIGLSKSGGFQTAQLKEYPTAFSKALAQATFDSLLRRHRKCDTRFGGAISAESLEWVDQVRAVCSTVRDSAEMLPDYQPGV